MVIETKNGLKILRGVDGYQALFIDSSRIDDCVHFLREHSLRNISINPFQGYKADNLEFLSSLDDHIEGITILDDKYDYSIVNKLHRLKSLGILDNKRDIVDLSNFPHLESLSCDYSPRLKNLHSCKELKSLTMSGYKSADNSLEGMPVLDSLSTLDLFTSDIASLSGIRNFPSIHSLSVYKANRLIDISNLRDVRSTLTKVEFDSCKRIINYNILRDILNLEKLIVSNSNAIPSLNFIRSLKELEFLSFVNTDIEDGDLSPCTGLKYVGFNNRRHYNMKFSDFQKP